MDPRAALSRRMTTAEAPLELFADRGTYAGLLVLMVVFLCAAVIIASERPGLAILFGVIGTIGAFGCICATLSRRPRIVIDEHGIHDHMHGPAVIPWQDLNGVEIGGDGEAYLYLRDPSRTLERFGWRSLLMSAQLTWPRERRKQQQGPRGLRIGLGGLAAGRDLAAAQFEWAVETFGPPDLLWRGGKSPARAAIAARKAERAAKSRAGDGPPILPG
jgi:hypothetical protein